jgi:hypothetical protein
VDRPAKPAVWLVDHAELHCEHGVHFTARSGGNSLSSDIAL